ncbi:hypothetical protein IV203_000087 [Nitzschia inconspicua]|uniref:Uncharacterized protein n=1 Tax=Nitzschia inconspicua TaxID=303405 RepID=A0A9K3L5X5_9STRA|nr:hypothetical protein IV203_000087 [Nitzschia inconspicua]
MNPIPFADDPVSGKPISLAKGDVKCLSRTTLMFTLELSLAINKNAAGLYDIFLFPAISHSMAHVQADANDN